MSSPSISRITCSAPWPTMTRIFSQPAARAVSITQERSGRPAAEWRTLGMAERIRVPLPAASTTAIRGLDSGMVQQLHHGLGEPGRIVADEVVPGRQQVGFVDPDAQSLDLGAVDAHGLGAGLGVVLQKLAGDPG